MYDIYEVGGCIRDELLGIQSKDIDYTFVLKDTSCNVDDGFAQMTEHLIKSGYRIFLSTPESFTIRAMFPKGHVLEGTTADFVMARKELGYKDGTRQPILCIGTLIDDLERRDFTVNAIAKSLDGKLIDPFNGQDAIKRMVLDTPIDPMITMMDDPLRMLRALRFSITKNMKIADRVWESFTQPNIVNKLKDVVSNERIREELQKMFKFDSLQTLRTLQKADEHAAGFLNAVFDNDMWLLPTFKR